MKSLAKLLTLLLAVASAGAQAPVERLPPKSAQTPIPTIKAHTRLVNIPLNVADAHGAPVGGLTVDDFTLTEDGKVQKIAIFERSTTSPLSIVLAIDASESVLRDENLERNAAKHFIKALIREQDEVDLMDFSDTVREIVPFTNNLKRIDAGLSELERGDATALYDAIYLASQRLGETHSTPAQPVQPGDLRRRVIVLITDGNDTVKGSHYTQAIEEAQRAGAMVYSLIIVPVYADAGRNTGGEHALIQMADDTGGKYYYVSDPKDLEPALRHVSDDLRTQYLLGYYAPPRDPRREDDASLRTVTIKLKDSALSDKYDLRYRKSYFGDSK
jgi:Ca-activated chloride channel family protein